MVRRFVFLAAGGKQDRHHKYSENDGHHKKRRIHVHGWEAPCCSQIIKSAFSLPHLDFTTSVSIRQVKVYRRVLLAFR
jgi:hypothetical protein